MRCRKCDYPLWNLRARNCPECGLEFTPSSYDFIGNSVQYRCTECGQDYYGTDEKGHLVPPEFNCVSCGARQHMDIMILLPTEGLTEEQTQTDDMPWLDRPGVKAWFKTGWRAATAPTRLAKTIPPQAGSWPAWKFAIINGLVLALMMVWPFFFFQTAFIAGGPIVSPWTFVGAFAGWVLGIWIGSVLFCLVWGAVAHGVLRMTGKTAAGIGATYQGILYPSWINLPAPLVPLCGLYGLPISGIWWSISAGFMISYLQRTGGLRTALAVCVLPILVASAPFALMIYGFASAAANSATVTAFPNPREVSTLTQSLNDYVVASGAFPAHAAGLLDTGVLPSEFVSGSSVTTTADVPVGSKTLEDAKSLSANQLAALGDEAAGALPQNVVAHRLGDFVFTYHGVDSTNPSLWTVILWPDPDVNPRPFQVFVGLSGGGTRTYYPGANFTTALQGQNQFRAAAGLAPIPDPSTITHSSPATGP